MVKKPQLLGDIVFQRTYAATKSDGKKETWEECVERNKNMHIKKFPHLEEDINYFYTFVLEKRVMPSMRSIQFSGHAIEQNHCRLFNCAFTPIRDFKAFGEMFYILMCGTGAGFSVRRMEIKQIPKISTGWDENVIVDDSKEGWADAVISLFHNPECQFDLSLVRPSGAPLSTGGTASGAEPLAKCLEQIRLILKQSIGRQLTSIEVADIVCYIADAVVVGGVRRAALICGFDKDDADMLNFKQGAWWENNQQRARANISAILGRDVTNRNEFEEILDKCFDSNCGEPGIVWIKDDKSSMFTNPCVIGETLILTKDGEKRIDSCLGQSVEIWNGFEWSSVSPKQTGENQKLRKITFSDDSILFCTEYHKFHIILPNFSLVVVTANELIKDAQIRPYYLPDGLEKTVTVISNEDGGFAERVYCYTEPKRNLAVFNGILTGNCGEISLNPYQFCNLVTVNVGACETPSQFLNAVEAATFIGTIQATYTNFTYLRPEWKLQTEDEALLGISLTGQAKNWKLLQNEWILEQATEEMKSTNKYWAKKLGINPAARIGTVKPEGSTSAFLETTSGIHAAHSQYYLRRVRIDTSHPIAKYLISKFGLASPEVGAIVEQDKFASNNIVLTIPFNMEGAILRSDESAIDLMERAKHIYTNWIKPSHNSGDNHHNVSLTVSYKPEEQEEIKEWMWANRENYSGISLLPYSGHTYVQAPFEEITKEQYLEWMEFYNSFTLDLTNLNYSGIADERKSESACAAGNCEIS